MDHHCRMCGGQKGGYPLTSMQRRILKWLFPQYNFSSIRLLLCHSCGKSVLKHKIQFVNNRTKKGDASIVIWNNHTSEPDCLDDGTPFRTHLCPKRSLNGCFRRSGSPLEPNEIVPTLAESNVLIDPPAELNEPTDHIAVLVEANVPRNPKIGSERSRRSTRQERLELLNSQVLQRHFEGLKEIETEIGRGVSTTRTFKREEFICTYHGELIDKEEADVREKKYIKQNRGCFMYYFKLNRKTYIIDGTEENPNFGIGRLINHRKREANIISDLIIINGLPYIYFWALEDIDIDIELFYNYNDSTCDIPWMRV